MLNVNHKTIYMKFFKYRIGPIRLITLIILILIFLAYEIIQ